MADPSLLLKLLVKASQIVEMGLKHKSTVQTLESTVKDLAPVVEQMEQHVKKMDHPTEEIRELMRKMEATQMVISKYSKIRWYNFYLTPYYQMKLEEADQSLVRYISVQIQMQMARDLILIRSKLSSDDSHCSQTTFAAETQTSYGAPTFKGDFEIPEPEFAVELSDPLDEFKFDVNLSGLAGSGKTALVDLASSSSSAPSSQSPKKYDVFISFRGEDTRTSFARHLQDALCRNKMETLEKGDEVGPALVKAIEESTLFLIVFSENYASSTWCLDELTKILEYSKDHGLPVIPVFYNISPSHVRNQRGSYQKAFSKYEHTKHNHQIQKWRAALTEAANLPGWDSSACRDDAQLIGQIVTFVRKKLDTMFQSVYYSGGLFGIHEQILHLESLVFNESEDVRFIGIWGMAGIGKTTLTKILLKKLGFAFEGLCFLANIREKYEIYGKSHLLNELLFLLLKDEESHMGMPNGGSSYVIRRLHQKRVLVVLDDVNDPEQIENLTGTPCWFGQGSRVIITTRDKEIFSKSIDDIYEVKALGFDEALQLFNFNVFKSSSPDKQFEQLSEKVVDISKGIPSTLIDLGCLFYGKSKEQWEKQLERITKISGTKIPHILQLYDGLDQEEKNIFLDIAGSFEGRKENFIRKIVRCLWLFNN